MARIIQNNQSGGKGNKNMFMDRNNKIFAAGKPTDQPQESVNSQFKCYSLQDEVDALISDTINPSTTMTKFPTLTQRKQLDMRHASIFSEGSELLNPPKKTKMQILTEDLKNTSYKSYWKKEVGKISDPVPTLPEGFNIFSSTCGLDKRIHDDLYDIIFPNNPVIDKTPISKSPGYQVNRNYCFFNKNSTFGIKAEGDQTGKSMKCCLTDERVHLGTAFKQPINEIQAKINEKTVPKLASACTPNNNASHVPEGFAFGKIMPPGTQLVECLKTCEHNKYKELILQCLGHLNTVRKCLSKRFDGSFFYQFYLQLKFLDKGKVRWLPKQVIYHQCKIRFIHLQSSLIEPLLTAWNALDEINNKIDYKKFVHIINYREPSPELPKFFDVPEEYLDFRTTYGDMVRENQVIDARNMAGIPSGRYFDKDYPITPEGCCKADRIYLPHESDARTCLTPSILTSLGVSHRDLYAKRERKTIKEVFERAGYKMDQEKFNIIWEMAEKYHSQKWVCYENFRKCLCEYEKNLDI